MHRVLARQMRRLGIGLDEPPPDVATWKQFVERVEGFYEDADRSRYRLERSLSVSSEELLQANRELAEVGLARLERSEAHYKDLFRQSPIPTWEEDFTPVERQFQRLKAEGVVDIESYLWENPQVLTDIVTSVVITDVNPAVGRLVDIDNPETLIGPASPSLVSKENTAAWIDQLKAVWDGSGTLRIDHLVGERADGQVFHGILEWHAPMVRGAYDYSRVIVSIVDITERVIAEEKMANILKSKDEFLASISHELRTPLTSVLGFAEVLRSMENGTDDEMDSILEIIASQAADLSNIVEDLLVAARAELGQLSVVSVPIDVHAQIAQVVEGRSGGSKIVDVGERPSEPMRAIGDPERVRQILRNLLTNAELYGGPNLGIEVEVAARSVCVRVCDDGPGLPGEMRERVFERYYRAQADDGKPGSVGIGLTISRDLARMMGGELSYDYVDGYSVFELTLPKA